MGKAVGIDLGTTNSVIAVVEGGQPIVIPNAEVLHSLAATEQAEARVGAPGSSESGRDDVIDDDFTTDGDG